MIANAAFVATLIFLALGFWSMHTLHFLTSWRSLIVHSYLKSISLYGALLFANILGLTIRIERKFFLRDTGRKLRHFDQEIHTGRNELSDEIRSRPYGADNLLRPRPPDLPACLLRDIFRLRSNPRLNRARQQPRHAAWSVGRLPSFDQDGAVSHRHNTVCDRVAVAGQVAIIHH
jgi:hypothetical protein